MFAAHYKFGEQGERQDPGLVYCTPMQSIFAAKFVHRTYTAEEIWPDARSNTGQVHTLLDVFAGGTLSEALQKLKLQRFAAYASA